jgi:hypothetical protein
MPRVHGCPSGHWPPDGLAQAPISARVAASNNNRAASRSVHSTAIVRGLAEQLDVVVGQPGEQHDGTPAFFSPQFDFGAGRFGA